MIADYFRKMFNYHFTLNKRIWDYSIMELTDEQFLRDLPFSIGSIRNQTVHMMSVDQGWFAGLHEGDTPGFLDPQDFGDRAAVRAKWDDIELAMRVVLGTLTDARLGAPYAEELKVWEALFHVLNHGTDHRAQIIAMIDQMGVPTIPQDYIYFVFGMDMG